MVPQQLLDCITKSKAIEFLLYLLEHGKTQSSRIFHHFYPSTGTISNRVKDLWVPCHLIKKSVDLTTNLFYYELTPQGEKLAHRLKELVAFIEELEEEMKSAGALKTQE